MSKHHLISAYTPSNMASELREKIFIQRHKLLNKTVKWLADSVTSGDKSHLLFIGPRGCGKTLLVSMAQYRITQIPEIQDSLRIVWLGEDDIITGFIDLALAILKQLTLGYPDEFNHECQLKAVGMAPDDAADLIFADIIQRLGDKTILLLMENLDLTFKGLQDSGQKKWRAFLQETLKITTLATSQQLFKGIASRDAAFFGFFDIYHLKVLSFEDAHQLISNIAVQNQQQDLVEFLDSATGRYRVRALHHLAGGNHRLYIELSSFLTLDSLDGLVQALEGLADELTPFFQERIRSLPPQQARLIQWLCDFGGAASVKSIAQSTFIQEGSVSKQLGELKKKSYLISEKRGKETYFELAEPLMRLSMETKNQRGKPLQLIVSFLKVWFSEQSLNSDGKNCVSSNELINKRLLDYQKAALEMDDSFLHDVKQHISEKVVKCININNWHDAKMLADELISADPVAGYQSLADIHRAEGQPEDVIAALSQIIELSDAANDQKIRALFNRAISYFLISQYDDAIKDYSILLANKNLPAEMKPLALFSLGEAHGQKEEYNKQIDFFSKALQIKDIPIKTRTIFLFRYAEVIWTHQSQQEARAALTNAFEQGDNTLSEYASRTNEILATILTQPNDSWPATIKWLIELYSKHHSLDKLSNALIASIIQLSDVYFNRNLIEKWNTLWQQQGADIEALTIALESLDAVTESILGGNDRPLFKLPKEIRELIRPLLGDIFERKK